jgi:hypothetical protein
VAKSKYDKNTFPILVVGWARVQLTLRWKMRSLSGPWGIIKKRPMKRSRPMAGPMAYMLSTMWKGQQSSSLFMNQPGAEAAPKKHFFHSDLLGKDRYYAGLFLLPLEAKCNKFLHIILNGGYNVDKES